MRDDFCVFILTHGRPDNVVTYAKLLAAGYTGKVYIVIDNEDDTEDAYRKRYGDKVLQFDKKAEAALIDEGDNFHDRRVIIHARNVCFRLAEEVGCKYFIEFDDDYTSFHYRKDSKNRYVSRRVTTTMDQLLEALLVYFIETPQIKTICLSQGADHMGGDQGPTSLRRKVMNSFICSVDRPFRFFGKINEDVNLYTTEARRGALFFSVMSAHLVQKQTQQSDAGMTEIYLDKGTYFKSFYSVMYAPSCVQIALMGDPRKKENYRIHHRVAWNNTAALILREEHRKAPTAYTVT